MIYSTFLLTNSTIFKKNVALYDIWRYNEQGRGVAAMNNSAPKRWDIGERMYEAYEVNITEPSSTHWHSCFLLTLIIDGKGTQILNGAPVEISRGSMAILSPVDFHSTVALDPSIVMYAVKFSDKIFYDSLAMVCKISNFPIVTHLNENDFATAKNLFKLLFDEQKQSLLASHIFAVNLIEQLAILALRSGGGEGDDMAGGMIKRALIYIHCNFRSQIKAADVASHVGYSSNYFSSEFKKQIGVEFQKYLSDSRLDFAKKLLQLPQFSITEVCFECGFNTYQHFSRAFKSKFGITPKEMKEKSNEKHATRKS